MVKRNAAAGVEPQRYGAGPAAEKQRHVAAASRGLCGPSGTRGGPVGALESRWGKGWSPQAPAVLGERRALR
ncbi:hypothetical protein NDU88_004329 [Pleurodeles waltl]|uniref:Uncharacterized protein n=1 Tax=Pleurodeles waltl TaxID=8319 RepID=A0AAV7M617_PLEWA|nr:hypothetical protein NDU88_004329 [Pleurodeles waltl]